MVIPKNTFVRLQGSAVILVTSISFGKKIFSGYNVTSTSMKLKSYEIFKIKEELVGLDTGIQTITNTTYDKNAEDRVDEVLKILQLDIKPKFKPSYKKARNRYHYRKRNLKKREHGFNSAH